MDRPFILEVTQGHVLNVQRDWARPGEPLEGHAVAIAACQEWRDDNGASVANALDIFSLTPGAVVDYREDRDRQMDTFQIVIDLGTGDSPAVNAIAVAVLQKNGDRLESQVLPFRLNL